MRDFGRRHRSEIRPICSPNLGPYPHYRPFGASPLRFTGLPGQILEKVLLAGAQGGPAGWRPAGLREFGAVDWPTMGSVEGHCGGVGVADGLTEPNPYCMRRAVSPVDPVVWQNGRHGFGEVVRMEADDWGRRRLSGGDAGERAAVGGVSVSDRQLRLSRAAAEQRPSVQLGPD